ncbi:hypothetical protein BD779DRAFT_272893 [Infundibulicybe gibba]|nr:hypothetical protein BD779DRAFT_272893 [Infundibulicybe gibba]
MGSFPQKKRYSTTPTSATPRRHPLDREDLRAPHSRHTGAHLLEQCTAVLWPIHQGRPGLPQRLTLRWPSLHRSEKVLAAPSLTITKDQGGEPIKRKSDTQDSARKIDVQKSGMRKTNPKIASAPKTGARRTSARKAQNDSWRAGTQKVGTQNAGRAARTRPEDKTKDKTKEKAAAEMALRCV